MEQVVRQAVPVAPEERIVSLDVLRGFAVLGILIMNIQSFSMIMSAYVNPTAYGDLTGLNRLVWSLSHIFADHKFMTIFSILYGAGIVLLTRRAEARGERPGSLHYRRTIWLIVFGLLHAYLLWYGDILFKYGICALFAYLFRNLQPRRLLIVGLVIFSVTFFLYLLFGFSVPYWPEEALENSMKMWKPEAATVAEQVGAYQSGWLGQMNQRVTEAIGGQTFLLAVRTFWRVLGLMLVGMALFKWGVLSAERSNRFYMYVLAIGYAVGFPLVIYGLLSNNRAGWEMGYSLFQGQLFNYWGSIFVSMGYIGTVMLVCRSLGRSVILKPLSAVGRMAFTNYIMQSIICTTIFYGHGFGMFGRVERTGQILIVFAVWAFQLVVSPLWLRRFRYGPLEWLWRSLSYRRRLHI
jgi:uncharacterized protein